jgi:hypothetical protein
MNINDFESNLVGFTAKKILSAQLLWTDLNQLNADVQAPCGEWTNEKFIDTYAYAIEGNELFEEISFSKDDAVEMFAEIYGGGRNGGAGRCGNVGGVQVKGVGRTVLVGKVADHWHSYGGFSLREAMLEILNSVVFSEILPCGAARCYGLILTGNKTALQPHKLPDVTGRGVLLVRESCLRPAHFFPNDNFVPKPQHKYKFQNDKLRLKTITKKLSFLLGDAAGYDVFLKTFLDNCANQFAYSKIFRIFHGAINGTNISLDGKWLDLTTASFIESGQNYVGSDKIPSFYAEHCTVLNFIDKLIKSYAFYNGAAPSKAALTSYYSVRFSFYIKAHFLTLIGLESKNMDILDSGYLDVLVNEVWDVIVKDAPPIHELPIELSENDPVTNLLERWFASFYQWFAFRNQLEAGRGDDTSAPLYRVIKSWLDISNESVTSVLHTMAIKSLRMAYFSGFFYKRRVDNEILKEINTPNLSYFSELIETFKSTAKWVFQDSNDHLVTICELKEFTLTFDRFAHVFNSTLNGELRSFSSERDLLNFVSNIEEEYFLLNGYSFKRGLIKICTILVG